MLLILTAIDKVYINYNTPNQIGLDILNVDEAKKYINNDEFAKGSMLPKIEACISFVENSNNVAIITSLENAFDALNNNGGTRIIEGKKKNG